MKDAGAAVLRAPHPGLGAVGVRVCRSAALGSAGFVACPEPIAAPREAADKQLILVL